MCFRSQSFDSKFLIKIKNPKMLNLKLWPSNDRRSLTSTVIPALNLLKLNAENKAVQIIPIFFLSARTWKLAIFIPWWPADWEFPPVPGAWGHGSSSRRPWHPPWTGVHRWRFYFSWPSTFSLLEINLTTKFLISVGCSVNLPDGYGLHILCK